MLALEGFGLGADCVLDVLRGRGDSFANVVGCIGGVLFGFAMLCGATCVGFAGDRVDGVFCVSPGLFCCAFDLIYGA